MPYPYNVNTEDLHCRGTAVPMPRQRKSRPPNYVVVRSIFHSSDRSPDVFRRNVLVGLADSTAGQDGIVREWHSDLAEREGQTKFANNRPRPLQMRQAARQAGAPLPSPCLACCCSPIA